VTETDPDYQKMLRYREWYRTTFDISPGANVAVFKFKYPNGATGFWAIHSDPTKNTEEAPTGHSERRAYRIMTQLGIDTKTVAKTLSELETCTLPRRDCKGLMAREFPKTEIGHLRPYSADKAVRDASMKAHRAENRRIVSQFKATSELFNAGGEACGGASASARAVAQACSRGRGGALPRALAGLRPGGIDFSSLELRYVSDRGGDLGYAFRAPTSATPGDATAGLETARQSSDAFFTWLALPPESFWVNLNPSQPDRILDPQLARTDAGRVLLEADMQMKRTVSATIRPDTPAGDQFWDELERIYGDRALESCISSRQWITPEPATVREEGDQLYIIDAPLTVKMESELINDPGASAPGCPQESQPIEDAKEELFRRVILPPVIHAINTAPEYAALRRVYLARVAAEWFRVRGGERPTAVSTIISSGNVDPWIARSPWDPMTVFNQMLTSIRNGEWTVERETPSGGTVYKRVLTYGGVDFSQTPRQNVSQRDFKARYPRLAKQVRTAQVEPLTDPGQGEAWIGGGDDRAPITSSSGAPLDQLAVGLHVGGPLGVRPGGRVSYRLRVSNVTPGPVSGVQVCDRLPRDLVFARASRPRRVRDGSSCWRIDRIAGFGSADIRVTARVLDGARGSMRDTATVSVPGRPDVARISRQRRFRVSTGGGAQPAPAPPGGVTG
jgi:uncharacterized repeat protein (TIGR01451 family)